jgi:hypothetical protein
MFETTDGWTRCPRGELQQLAGRLRGRRRLRTALTVLGAIVATTVAVGSIPLAASLIAHSGGGSSSTCGSTSTAVPCETPTTAPASCAPTNPSP